MSLVAGTYYANTAGAMNSELGLMTPAQFIELINTLKAAINSTERLIIALAVICTICVALRVFVKIRMTKSFKFDDHWMICAYVLFIVDVALGMRLVALARRLVALDFSVIDEGSRVGLASQVFYILCTIACKASVGLFLLALFPPHERWRKYPVHLLFWLSVVLGFAFMIMSCSIVNNKHDPGVNASQDPVSRATEIVGLIWTIVNMVADVVYAALCVPVIWSAKFMPVRTKLVASILLCFGSVGVVASIMRLVVYLGAGWSNVAQQRILLARYSIMETGLCIAAASLASTRPLFAQWLGAIKQLSSGTRTKATTASRTSHSVGLEPYPPPGGAGGIRSPLSPMQPRDKDLYAMSIADLGTGRSSRTIDDDDSDHDGGLSEWPLKDSRQHSVGDVKDVEHGEASAPRQPAYSNHQGDGNSLEFNIYR